MPSTTMAAAIRGALDQALAASPDTLVLGESVGRMGGLAGCTTGLADTWGANRVRDLPVADRGTLGVALGLALGGKRPIVEIAGTNRLLAGVEVLAQAAAIARRGDFPVPLIVRCPWGTEAGAADASIAPLAAIDGLRIACAADAGTAAGLLRTALAGTGPVVILEARAAYDARSTDDGAAVPFAARTLRSGDHVTLAGWGLGALAALDAADALAADGLSAEVLDLVSIAPIDTATLGASVRRTGRLVVAHPQDAALADAVRRVGLDEAFLYLESPLARASEAPRAIADAARGAIQF